jgi:hypothetical protein
MWRVLAHHRNNSECDASGDQGIFGGGLKAFLKPTPS